MDLGFGGFLEKFENHFGSGLTKAMLILIGLAVASLCGSVIWAYLLLPIAQLIPDPRSGTAYQFAKLVLILALFLMLTNQLLDLADNYLKKKLRGRLRENVERSERLMEELKDTRAEVDLLHKQVGDNNAASRLILDEAIATALEQKLLTSEQVAEFRGLLDQPLNSEDRQA
jgi:Na+/melibiose symporter-like transporter